jgi:peptidoglycan/xylan/chitin deacetylase (PgdA/CDA1 family)
MPVSFPFSLPPLAAIPVSAEMRLAYVLRHFQLAYQAVPELRIGYDASATIRIGAGAGSFFNEQAAYPAAPQWREWQGTRLPFFFDFNPAAPLLTLTAGRAEIGPDIIAAAFYLLSGWQEYFSDERDQHGRFPYAASVQQRYGFVAQPIVNYYFDLLRAAVEHLTGQALLPRRWAGNAPFAAFITHDIDTLNGGWGTAARQLLGRGQLFKLSKLLLRRATRQPAPWDNLELVQQATARYGAPSTFFMLSSRQVAPNGTANADYDLSRPDLLQRLTALNSQGAELSLHGSYGTAVDKAKLLREKAQLAPRPVAGNRFHYLGWEPRQTPALVAAADFSYDSTLGFAEHYGFRNSYCQPYFPFDFAHGQAFDFLEIPLTVMDATLHHPKYLQLAAAEILPALVPVFTEVEKFGGVATLLWHNDHFDPNNEQTGPRQFHELMAYLQSRGAAFRTGSQIVAELCQP